MSDRMSIKSVGGGMYHVKGGKDRPARSSFMHIAGNTKPTARIVRALENGPLAAVAPQMIAAIEPYLKAELERVDVAQVPHV